MPRANRYFLPGFIWHITHRCHNRDFLLRFSHDKINWLHWLFEAKKRYGLRILNYMVTSNHVHLLVIDSNENCIAKSIQLIAGRVAQEYNLRKKRSGAFWEDRYHATAVMQNDYLLQCLVYIDLNMVRAGVVSHPSLYSYCGYNEIIKPPLRYGLIDIEGLTHYCGFNDRDQFIESYKSWINKACEEKGMPKDLQWSESIAVGSEEFINGIREKLGVRVKSRHIQQHESCYLLKEPCMTYDHSFCGKNVVLSGDNRYFWQ